MALGFDGGWLFNFIAPFRVHIHILSDLADKSCFEEDDSFRPYTNMLKRLWWKLRSITAYSVQQYTTLLL